MHPARLARGLRVRLRERGVLLFEHTRVRALRDGPGTVVAETAGGHLAFRGAALAEHPMAAAVGPLRRRLTVTSSHMVITEPVPDVLEAVG